ncbi:hypothetical protein F5Y14DRAFT_61239 [Nemania sp. NC0429]|nr:hypothetical protein F5Y14DRAFT_61239 [Nemania sp. NC0429]
MKDDDDRWYEVGDRSKEGLKGQRAKQVSGGLDDQVAAIERRQNNHPEGFPKKNHHLARAIANGLPLGSGRTALLYDNDSFESAPGRYQARTCSFGAQLLAPGSRTLQRRRQYFSTRHIRRKHAKPSTGSGRSNCLNPQCTGHHHNHNGLDGRVPVLLYGSYIGFASWRPSVVWQFLTRATCEGLSFLGALISPMMMNEGIRVTACFTCHLDVVKCLCEYGDLYDLRPVPAVNEIIEDSSTPIRVRVCRSLSNI